MILIHEAAILLCKANLHVAHYFNTHSDMLVQRDLEDLTQTLKNTNIFCEHDAAKDMVYHADASNQNADAPIGALASEQIYM